MHRYGMTIIKMKSFKRNIGNLEANFLEELAKRSNVSQHFQLKVEPLDMNELQSIEEETQLALRQQFTIEQDEQSQTVEKQLEQEAICTHMNPLITPKPLYPTYLSKHRPPYPICNAQLRCADNKIDFDFDVDLSNPTLSSFLFTQNTITKQQGEEWLMVYASNYIPYVGYHSIKARINCIKDGQMCLGLVTQPHKNKPLAGNQKEALKLSLDGTQIMIEGNILPLQFRPFQEYETIEMCVDIARKMCRFYRNGRDKHFLDIIISESTANTKLFPFIEIAEIGGSLELLL